MTDIMWSNVSNSYVNIFQHSCDQISFNQSCASADWLLSTIVVQSLTSSHGEHYLSLCWGYPRIYQPAERQSPPQVWRTGGEEACWSWWVLGPSLVLTSPRTEPGPSSSPVPLRLDQLETGRARPGPSARPPPAQPGLYYLSPDQRQTRATILTPHGLGQEPLILAQISFSRRYSSRIKGKHPAGVFSVLCFNWLNTEHIVYSSDWCFSEWETLLIKAHICAVQLRLPRSKYLFQLMIELGARGRVYHHWNDIQQDCRSIQLQHLITTTRQSPALHS